MRDARSRTDFVHFVCSRTYSRTIDVECPRFFLVSPLYSGQKAEICSRTALDHSLSLPRKLPRGNSIEVSGELPDTSADSVETAVRGPPRQLAGELPAGQAEASRELVWRASSELAGKQPFARACRRASRQLRGDIPDSCLESFQRAFRGAPDSYPESLRTAFRRAPRKPVGELVESCGEGCQTPV